MSFTLAHLGPWLPTVCKEKCLTFFPACSGVQKWTSQAWQQAHMGSMKNSKQVSETMGAVRPLVYFCSSLESKMYRSIEVSLWVSEWVCEFRTKMFTGQIWGCYLKVVLFQSQSVWSTKFLFSYYPSGGEVNCPGGRWMGGDGWFCTRETTYLKKKKILDLCNL